MGSEPIRRWIAAPQESSFPLARRTRGAVVGLDTRFLGSGLWAPHQGPEDAGDSSNRQRRSGERIVGDQPDDDPDGCGQGEGHDDGFAVWPGPGNEQPTREGEDCGHDVGPGIHGREVRVSAHANDA